MNTKILVVEDEALVAIDIKQILAYEGYTQVYTTSTVENAIQLIEEHTFALILIDIILNRSTDGITLGEYLIKKDTIPFIYITAFSDKVTLDRAKTTRPYAYIVKPFKPVDITTTVYMVLNTFAYKNIDVLRNHTEINSAVPFRIKETINYINQHIYEKIELQDIAALTPWKLHHFIRIFTKYLGITPYQYILKAKIEKAAAILVETNQPIHEIAFDLGFKSYSNFANAFNRFLQESPEIYRNKQKARSFLE